MGPLEAGAVALARSCHPEPTAAVTLMVTALAVTSGRSAAGVVLVFLAVLTGQLSIGWLNDALDADRDKAVGRTDKPVVAGAVSVRTVRGAALVPGLACVPLSLASGLFAGGVHLVAVAAGWAYDLGLKSTRWSVLPYVVCFGLLPAFVVLGLPGAPLPPWWLVAGGALLGAGAHFANVLPDLDDDAATGVRGLPTPARCGRQPGGGGGTDARRHRRARARCSRSALARLEPACRRGRDPRRRSAGRARFRVASAVPGRAGGRGDRGGPPRRGRARHRQLTRPLA